MRLFFKTFVKQKLRYKGFLFFFLLMTLVVSLASVLMTQTTGDMSQAALDLDTGVLLRFFGIITILMIIRATAAAVAALLLGRFAGKTAYHFRNNFVKFFLKKPFSAYEDTKSGKSLSIFANDLPATVQLVSSGGISLIADILILLVTLAYMMYIHWWLTLIFIASFPVLIILQVLISIPLYIKGEEILEARANITATANDSFQNTSTIVAYSLEDVMGARYETDLEEWVATVKSWALSHFLLVMAGMVTSIIPLLLVIALASYQVIAGNMGFAEVIAFVALAIEAAMWLLMLSQQQEEVQTAAAGAGRMDRHMTNEQELIHMGNTLVPSGDVAISVENLKFSYPTREESPLALDDISFDIKKGSRVAFVGGSGSGKSTVLKLLLGLYPLQDGNISVMGTDTTELSLHSLRHTYSYVPQDSFLFPESILENITGQSTVSDQSRLEKACRDAGILEFIESLPDKFDAKLGESAENVSGGQKQRIALARAFYHDSPIILFDEATSALDPTTEAAVLQSFNTLAKDKTVIMVAHRLKTIDFCETIIVMDNGKVVAMGTHDELINNSPVYENLYNTQKKEALM